MYYHIKLESLNTVLGYGFDFGTLKVKKDGSYLLLTKHVKQNTIGYGFDFGTLKVKKDGSYLLLTKHVKQTPEVYRPLETFLRKLN